jgi:hypothetical protein
MYTVHGASRGLTRQAEHMMNQVYTIDMMQLAAQITSVWDIHLWSFCIQKTRGRVIPKHTCYTLYVVRRLP